MSVFFNDNPNREKRVRELCTQAVGIQRQIEEAKRNADAQEETQGKYLAALALRAGYSTPDAYIRAGMRYMTDAQRREWLYLCEQSAKQRSISKTGKLVAAGIGITGSVIRLPRSVIRIGSKLQMFVLALQGISKGIVDTFKSGTRAAGFAAMKFWGTILKGNWTRQLHVGAGGRNAGFDIGLKTSKALKVLTRVAKVLQGIGFVAEIVFLGWDIAQGKKDKEDFQAALLEAGVTRFALQKILKIVSATQLFVGQMTGVMAVHNQYDTDIKAQKVNPPANPRFRVRESDMLEAVSKKIGVLEEAFDTTMKAVNNNDVIAGDVRRLDTPDSWTKEDPSIETILAELEKKPLVDDNGKPVIVEGPDPDSIFLEWTATSYNAESPNQSITFRGVNESTSVTQSFNFIQLRFPLKPQTIEQGYTEWLFTDNQFKIKGSNGPATGTVEVTADSGVTVPASVTAKIEYDTDLNLDPDSPASTYNLVCANWGTQSDENGPEATKIRNLPSIVIPPGKAIYFTVTGTTGPKFPLGDAIVQATAHESRSAPEILMRWEDVDVACTN